MMKNKKGSIAFEAVTIIFIIFMLFIGSYAVYQQKARELILSKAELDERNDCLHIANAVTSMTMMPGASLNFTIYNAMTVEPAGQRIQSSSSFCTFPVKNIRNSTGSSDRFTVNAGRISITSEDGYVTISNT